jgi:hypothetical protein
VVGVEGAGEAEAELLLDPSPEVEEEGVLALVPEVPDSPDPDGAGLAL